MEAYSLTDRSVSKQREIAAPNLGRGALPAQPNLGHKPQAPPAPSAKLEGLSFSAEHRVVQSPVTNVKSSIAVSAAPSSALSSKSVAKGKSLLATVTRTVSRVFRAILRALLSLFGMRKPEVTLHQSLTPERKEEVKEEKKKDPREVVTLHRGM